MAKIKTVHSNSEKKVDIEKIIKGLGAESFPPLEQLVDYDKTFEYIELGDPVILSLNNSSYLKIGKINSFEHGLQYIVGRFAANHNIERSDIIKYRLLEKGEAKDVKEELGVEGYVIQFYTSKKKLKKVEKHYEESDVRVYIL